jgi:hypothetical protein
MESMVNVVISALRHLPIFDRRLIVCCCLIVWLMPAWGQEPAHPTNGKTVEEVEPVTTYLKDEKGNLVPVPGLSYERFRELLLLERNATREVPPEYTLEQAKLSGNVTAERADYVIELKVLSHRTGWLKLPLRLNSAQLNREITVPKGMEFMHRYDAKEGHSLWLNVKQHETIPVKIPLASRVKRVGAEYELSLELPKANDATLDFSMSQEVTEVTLAAGEGILEKGKLGKSKQIHLIAASGDVRVAWMLADEQAARAHRDIEVTTNLSVRVESRDVVTLTADMQMKRSSRKIDHLFVRVPPRFEPAVSGSEGVKLTPVSEQELAVLFPLIGNKKPTPGKVLRVDFDSLAETQRLFITAVYQPEETKRTPVELGGFEVLGAGRQTGQISIGTQQGWGVKTTPDAAVLRIDEVLAEAATAESRGTLKYRFVKQPYSLKLDIQPQATKTSVETFHAAQVSASGVRLQSTFQVRVRGPRPEFLEFDVADWEIMAVNPADEVVLDSPAEPGKPLRLKLLAGKSSDLVIELECRRGGVPNGDISFALPRCLAAQLFPALLSIERADNLSLTPNAELIRALAPEEKPSRAFSKAAERAEWFYRELPSATERPLFGARVVQNARHSTVIGKAHARFYANRVEVEHLLQMHIEYEPLDSLWLDWPASSPLQDLQVLQGERWVTVETANVEANRAAAASAPANTELGDAVATVATPNDAAVSSVLKRAAPLGKARLVFPNALLGSATLTCRYSVPLVPGEAFFLPLVVPVQNNELKMVQQELTWECKAAIAWELAATHNTTPPTAQASTDQATSAENTSSHNNPAESAVLVEPAHLVWRHAIPDIPFQPQGVPTTNSAGLQIEKAWLQAWLSGGERRDRYTALFRTSQSSVELQLPSGVNPANLRVVLNGAPARISWRNERLQVAVASAPPTPIAPLQRLEMWYLVPETLASHIYQSQSLQLPGFVGAHQPQELFFQLMVPPAYRLTQPPPAFTEFSRWRKHGLWWEQTGRYSTAELETMFGLQPADVLDPPAHDYLMIALGSPTRVELHLARTHWLRLASMSSMFLGGLVVWWLSRGARWSLLLLFVFAIVMLLLFLPDLALLLSQSLVWGLLLLAAVLWSWRWPATNESTRGANAWGRRREGGSRITRESPTSTVALALPERRS